ncbi:hypothetical protein [Legionella drancourtii]|uniref:Uncharacterized protein n=1 Tax=Legionella drancourtii LLAP12 TaxID=658187 RepID=G9ERE2_9GAMM|nr:hypothetical protein [Legionella drancourtii]EHL30111.1 hypothetical protein LDG_7854 [Legionella drancourtii LLAP12]
MKTYLRASIATLCLSISSLAFAYEHGGGGYHNGGYHPNNVYNNGNYHGYHNNVWYDDGLNDDASANVVIGVPEGGYYDPSCQTAQTCTSDGECITQQNCN